MTRTKPPGPAGRVRVGFATASTATDGDIATGSPPGEGHARKGLPHHLDADGRLAGQLVKRAAAVIAGQRQGRHREPTGERVELGVDDDGAVAGGSVGAAEAVRERRDELVPVPRPLLEQRELSINTAIARRPRRSAMRWTGSGRW